MWKNLIGIRSRWAVLYSIFLFSITGCASDHPQPRGWPFECGCREGVASSTKALPPGEGLAAPKARAVEPATSTPASNQAPNIVLLIGDDHGWPYFGFMGNPIVKTPNLDALVHRGVVFTRCHAASSVCLPTLNAMLTGLYPYQYETAGNLKTAANPNGRDEPDLIKHLIPNDVHLLTRELAKKGYVSFEGGKLWHVTFDEAGFTEGMTSSTGDKSNIHPINVMAGAEGLQLGRVTNQPVYDFIDRHASEPLFIWYAPMLPHNPMDPPEKYLKLYDDHPELSASAKKYYANCTRFDDAAGQVIEYLRARGQLQNTIFIYFNDNGWEQAPAVEYTGDVVGSALGGDRGKLSAHEFGFRTPLIFAGPGINKPARKDGFVSQLDLFATILDFAGAPAAPRSDGHSLRAAVEGREDFSRPEIIGSMAQIRVTPDRPATGGNPWANSEQAFYITTPRWHLIHYETRGVDQLYDKTADPEERTDVAAGHPDVVMELTKKINAWKKRVTAIPVAIPGL